ncbi:dihydrofolate reductase [Candidatus Phytoplasma phoenicium]|uniref:dihydrofolate reductase n=1 Tax=Candidatus Phytoplasma phoenicium TaxID=198422 RepID=A0A0L0MKY9_9MOLU|nr:dihydrofolate reductase [Candidatus Phytoplasma phoenicium]KND62654.1 Dihydrofolate reductase [Candidatus Phytoplasma phoenicium]
MISLIAAVDVNFTIGFHNRLPWHFPKDLMFFRQKTLQKNVLMGWQTYLSLKQYYGSKPFPFKDVYVASHETKNILNINVINDLIMFLKKMKYSQQDLFIIGGSQIYHQSLSYVDVMYLTHVLGRYQGDSFFPRFDYKKYVIKKKTNVDKLIFVMYQKLKNSELINYV